MSPRGLRDLEFTLESASAQCNTLSKLLELRSILIPILIPLNLPGMME